MTPRRLADVAGYRRGELGVSVGQHLYGHAHIGHVGKRKTEEHIDVDVDFARFPDQRPLHQIHPWRCTRPLQDGRRDDRNF